MSLQVLYSFDHIITSDIVALPKVISAVGCSIALGGGRESTNGLVCTSSPGDGFAVALDTPNSNVTIGAWVMVNTANWQIMSLANPANSNSNNPWSAHTSLKAQNDGSIAVFQRTAVVGTFLGQSAGGLFSIGTPFYLEWQSQIGPTGSTIVRINGVEILHLNTVNNAAGSDISVHSVIFGEAQGNVRFDDIYILTAEDNGDGWTDFRGIIKVNAKLVNGLGDLNQWAPSTPTGINWQNVDEDVPSVVDFNDAASVGLVDTYQIEDATFDPIAVQTDLYMKKLDAGASSVAHVARIAGVNHVSAEIQTLGTTFKYFKKVYTKQPAGSPWTQAVFNALQVGPQRAV